MKVLLGSDLHLEFSGQKELPALPEFDIAVLAGDIGLGTAGVEWAQEFFPKNKTVLYVVGNHETYHRDVPTVNAQLTQDFGNVKVLNPGTYETDTHKFIGATLRSALDLPGYLKYAHSAFANAISDFRVCRNGDGLWTPTDHVVQHVQEVGFIAHELGWSGNQTEKKTVVITHFLPVMQCIDPYYQGNNINPYFCNDLDWLIEGTKPDLWLYGHTHSKYDGVHPMGTRLVCNPRGYPNEKKPFSWKVIDV